MHVFRKTCIRPYAKDFHPRKQFISSIQHPSLMGDYSPVDSAHEGFARFNGDYRWLSAKGLYTLSCSFSLLSSPELSCCVGHQTLSLQSALFTLSSFLFPETVLLDSSHRPTMFLRKSLTGKYFSNKLYWTKQQIIWYQQHRTLRPEEIYSTCACVQCKLH
jgi:hypothetical protein